ncbi:hypothetical protein [Bacillus sp. V5-8f]|uniref:hypothetical protein n=1 Tax=Bacillus sp. V5-8f TaxID=2053044 RepID=UPI0015E07250|nr:hypothetical protein [Bacillus sp. V5-8f]
MKRKANVDGVYKTSHTPYQNQSEQDFTNEFAVDENPMKGFNRNSKQGRKGRA